MSKRKSASPSSSTAPRVRSPRFPRRAVEQRHQRTTSEERTEPKVVLTEYDIMKLDRKGFRVDKPLSSGSCGQIFMMTYRIPEREADINAYKMAVKVVDRNVVEDNFIKKFLPREIEILSEIDHPYVVTVYAMMEMNEKAYFFMRYAENGDLLEYITKHGALPENHGRLWMRQLLMAVDYLDKCGIAHRDIKCENILVTANLNIQLADFGFARKYVNDEGKELMCETYCGSLSYAAPEILEGRPFCPKKVDVWSAGIVMFIMFNLEKPFKRKAPHQLLLAQQSKAYKWSQVGITKTSDDCKKMVDSMLEPDVSRRPRAAALLQKTWMTADPDVIKYTPEVREMK
uniref:Testis-specific serine/threonine-protein kinase 1 n=1 Tax=Lygus hesperus TaxID=30085 RepID=A0A0A9XTY6_LYGHE